MLSPGENGGIHTNRLCSLFRKSQTGELAASLESVQCEGSQADGPGSADPDALGVAPAEITVISMLFKDGQRVKGAALCPCLVPQEFLFFRIVRGLFSCKALHLPALAA